MHSSHASTTSIYLQVCTLTTHTHTHTPGEGMNSLDHCRELTFPTRSLNKSDILGQTYSIRQSSQTNTSNNCLSARLKGTRRKYALLSAEILHIPIFPCRFITHIPVCRSNKQEKTHKYRSGVLTSWSNVFLPPAQKEFENVD